MTNGRIDQSFDVQNIDSCGRLMSYICVIIGEAFAFAVHARAKLFSTSVGLLGCGAVINGIGSH